MREALRKSLKNTEDLLHQYENKIEGECASWGYNTDKGALHSRGVNVKGSEPCI